MVFLFTLDKFENCYGIDLFNFGDIFPSKQMHAQSEQQKH